MKSKIHKFNTISLSFCSKPVLVIPLKDGQSSNLSGFETIQKSKALSNDQSKKLIWGLEVKKEKRKKIDEDTSTTSTVPIILKNRLIELDKCKTESERFVTDLNLRPDEPSRESYSKIPVEEFGAAMLRGMGWKGPDSSEKNVPIKYVPRPERLGLGASEVQDSSELKKRKPIEESLGIEMSKEEERLVYQFDQRKSKIDPFELLQKHTNVIGINQSSPKRIKIDVRTGSRIMVSEGEHSGLKGYVKNESQDGNHWIVELEINGQNIKILKSHVRRYDSSKQSAVKLEKEENQSSPSTSILWVCTGLIVKIKSKSFENGRFYYRKGIILDVQNHDSCTMKLIDSVNEIVHKVPQRVLETCLPRVINPSRSTVKYLKKDHGDEFFHAPFRILEFDDDRGRAVIQADDNLEIVFEAHYDDICEFR